MNDELLAIISLQTEKLDKHLSSLRQSMHDTNETLQGVIGSAQLTRRDIVHNSETNNIKLEALKLSITNLQTELDKVGAELKKELICLDKEIEDLKALKERVDAMYKAYNIVHKVIITAVASGIIYATVMVTKIKSGG